MTKITMSQFLDELTAASRRLLETSQKAAVVYAADRVAEILDEDVEAVVQGTVPERIE